MNAPLPTRTPEAVLLHYGTGRFCLAVVANVLASMITSLLLR